MDLSKIFSVGSFPLFIYFGSTFIIFLTKDFALLEFLFNLLINPTSFKLGKLPINQIPNWVFNLYDFSHSIVIAFICIAIIYRINKEFCFPMYAWPFHIIVDFFTHNTQYLPTPIFWPISNYKFDGIPWSNPIIWFTNIFCIVLLFIYRKKY